MPTLTDSALALLPAASRALGSSFAFVPAADLLSPALASLFSLSERLRDVAGDSDDGTPLAYLAGLTDGSSPVTPRLARDLARKGYRVEREGLLGFVADVATAYGFAVPEDNGPGADTSLYALEYRDGRAFLSVYLGAPAADVASEVVRVSLPYLGNVDEVAAAVDGTFALAAAIAGEA